MKRVMKFILAAIGIMTVFFVGYDRGLEDGSWPEKEEKETRGYKRKSFVGRYI